MKLARLAIFALALTAVAASGLRADTAYPPFSAVPDVRPNGPLRELEGVGITQNLGKQIPLDLVFKDETGKSVKLGNYFDGKHPVIITLVYYDCPLLCTLVLNDLTRAMNGMTLSAGEDFEVVTVSFNPNETPKLAADKKDTYLASYRRPHADEGWHFLTGDDASIHQLADAIGFRYKWDAKFKQYIHPSGITILTPNGVISRYFFGIDYDLKDLKLSMEDASGDKIGSLTDQVLLYCFHYDESTGRYTVAIRRVMQAGAVMTMAALGAFWFFMFRRDHHSPGRPTKL
jgi:protein SCO1